MQAQVVKNRQFSPSHMLLLTGARLTLTLNSHRSWRLVEVQEDAGSSGCLVVGVDQSKFRVLPVAGCPVLVDRML